MGFADAYFSKQREFKSCFDESPSAKLCYAVVIPAYHEPDLITSLDSLLKCRHPKGHVEVIVVFNMPENAGQETIASTRKTVVNTSIWIDGHTTPEFRFLLIRSLMMPVRDAGVGLARKSGMDQALNRFNRINNPGGIILSFDADSRCDPDYFKAIEETMENHPETNGFNLYFEHPVSGNEFPASVYRGIVLYEMHLRYVNLFLRHTGFPHAYHTVGSCFGVKAGTYAREGGMNKKKAGEDFYFLHKIIQLGKFREINNTCITPSSRESDRVPFGTGAAIRKYILSGEPHLLTYSPACFQDLRAFFDVSGSLYRKNYSQVSSVIGAVPESMRNYLNTIGAAETIMKLNENSASAESFMNRFFRWFDAFRIIKYLNFASMEYYERIPVRLAVQEYLEITGNPATSGNKKDVELLTVLREIERKRA